MITSEQLMEATGISRATLNNYIALGILRKPLVQPGAGGQEGTARILYFPDAAVDRIKQVQELNNEGLSMSAITEQLNVAPPRSNDAAASDSSSPGSSSTPEDAPDSRETQEPTASRDSTLTVNIGVDDIPDPAYMVNNNFELTWWNDQASEHIFGKGWPIAAEIVNRNIIRMLIESPTSRLLPNWKELLSIHLRTAKQRIPAPAFLTMCASLDATDAGLARQLYESASPIEREAVIYFQDALRYPQEDGRSNDLYIIFFREGIFFVYIEAKADSTPLIELLANRDQVIRALLSKRRPFLTPLAVMVADLQNSVRICAELPPEEYFELINQIWQRAEPIFRQYYGTHGKHVGDGMVYYFFPQPDSSYILNAIDCACDLRELMIRISREWQIRKNWLHALHLNIGLDEGQEWFGTYQTSTNMEFTVLGDTVNNAARISDFASQGAIWVTKHMLGSLSSKERDRFHFGIKRRTENGEEIVVSNIYSRVSSLLDLSEGGNAKFQDIATLAVTEIINVRE